jgi:ParB-like chromosome segregation protein Spo0J
MRIKAKIVKGLESLAVPIDRVYADPANARVGHDIDGYKAAFKKYGQRTPLVANKDGCILKGNGGLKAAQELQWDHVAVVFVDDDPPTATGYAIADNRLGDKSHFDTESLKSLLASLDAPLDVPGVDQAFLDSLDSFSVDYGEGNSENRQSSAKEIDTEFSLAHKCPRCGFEYD